MCDSGATSSKEKKTCFAACLTNVVSLKSVVKDVHRGADDLPMAVVQSSYRAGRFLKALGYWGWKHQHVTDHEYMRRCVYAQSKNNEGATSRALAIQGGGFGGL